MGAPPPPSLPPPPPAAILPPAALVAANAAGGDELAPLPLPLLLTPSLPVLAAEPLLTLPAVPGSASPSSWRPAEIPEVPESLEPERLV